MGEEMETWRGNIIDKPAWIFTGLGQQVCPVPLSHNVNFGNMYFFISEEPRNKRQETLKVNAFWRMKIWIQVTWTVIKSGVIFRRQSPKVLKMKLVGSSVCGQINRHFWKCC
jgi:hypothetical protein